MNTHQVDEILIALNQLITAIEVAHPNVGSTPEIIFRHKEHAKKLLTFLGRMELDNDLAKRIRAIASN